MNKPRVSIDQVISNAWQSTKCTLFTSFSIERWFLLGFCCWMVTLVDDLSTAFNLFQNFFPPLLAASPSVFIGVLGGIILLAWIGGIAAFWLRSRFEFIFLDNLLTGNDGIREPWREFRESGNSFFWGYILFTVLVCIGHAFLLGLPGALGYFWISSYEIPSDFFALGEIRMWVLIVLLLIWGAYSIVTGFYFWYLFFLLVPIMYRDRVNFFEGFRRMHYLIACNLGKCILFCLMIAIILFGIMTVVIIAGVITCCVLWVLLGVPYIRAVLLLPVWTFLRFSGVALLQALDPREPEAAAELELVTETVEDEAIPGSDA